MINVPQMTAMFTRMTPQQRKEHAQMHKNDPYTISLLMGIDAQEKALRTAMQGEGQAAQQPTVVDQGIEQMDAPKQMAQALPENTGIGTLPQQPMQMAEGGIVAFADGGKASWEYELDALVNPESAEQRPGNMSAWEAAKRAFLYSSDLEAQRAQQPVTPDALAAQSAMQASASSNADRGNFPGQGATGTNITTPTVDKGGLKDLAAAAPRAAVSTPGKPELGYADSLKAAMGETPDFAAQRAASIAAEKAGAETGLEKLKTSLAAESEGMFKGREERVGKREAALEKSKDANTGMAFLEAGLAMMQSRRRGFAGIAEGAAVGTKQYASGIKDIRAAQEKLDDARDRIEELRQNQSSMNNKEIRAAEKGILDIVNRGNEKQLDGAEKLYGMKREDMRAAVTSDRAVAEATKRRTFEAGQSALDRASREAISKMPPAEIQKIALLGNGDFAKGYEIYKQEAAIPRLYESYTKLASDPLAGQQFQAKFPTFETYRAGMGGGGKILDVPDAATGTVRTR